VKGRSWDRVIAAEDREIYELAGFGRKSGFGEHPAVLVIDVQYRTVGDRPVPIKEAIQTMYPTACGDRGWAAVYKIAGLLEVARRANVPIIYPYVAPKRQADAGRFGQKNPQITSIPERGYAFVEDVGPHEQDIIIPKRHASAFFGTALTSYLIDLRVDTVLVTGCTTSGCVRATVADAFSYNFHTEVVEECVYDRIEISHLVSLFDIDAKYGDVVSVDEACRLLASGSSDPMVRQARTKSIGG
jgi:maleamate amidohydrolase